MIYTPPEATVYGETVNRIKPNFVLHVPLKEANALDTIDESPQMFVRGTTLVYYVGGTFYDVGAGGGGGRFGIEDNSSDQNRVIDFNEFSLEIRAGTPDYTGPVGDFYITSNLIQLYVRDNAGNVALKVNKDNLIVHSAGDSLYPVGEHYVPISVNGVFSGDDGNIESNLQAVTNAGNQTTNNILIPITGTTGNYTGIGILTGTVSGDLEIDSQSFIAFYYDSGHREAMGKSWLSDWQWCDFKAYVSTINNEANTTLEASSSSDSSAFARVHSTITGKSEFSYTTTKDMDSDGKTLKVTSAAPTYGGQEVIAPISVNGNFADANGNIEINVALIFECLISQTGASAPIMTILHNGLGVTPTVSRISAGNYQITFPSNVMTTNKSVLYFNNGTNVSIVTKCYINDQANILFYTVDPVTVTFYDEEIAHMNIKVEVYP